MDYTSKIKKLLNSRQLKELEDIKTAIKQKMPESLYRHSIQTMDFAIILAFKHYPDLYSDKDFLNQVCISSLLHDYGKILEKKDLLDIVSLNVKGLTDFEKTCYPCLHGYAAPFLIKRDFGINDKDIYNAISRHTTGSCNMSALDRIVYISDKLEAGRNYKNIEYLRELSLNNSDLCLLEVYKSNIIYVISKNCTLHPNTSRIWNYICGGYKNVT
jgi:predicted HD superfamily hydrolase involved in NAD metabolism